MNLVRRRFKGTATTLDSSRAALFALRLPLNGSFVYKGTVIARSAAGSVVVFSPVNSGGIAAGVPSQAAGTAQGALCKTSPADGGTAQGFAPRGVSSNTVGTGRTEALILGPAQALGVAADFVVVPSIDAVLKWAWDVEFTIQAT